MSGVMKIVGKVALVLAGSVALGYTEYRLKGGEPVTKLYRDVKSERLAMEAAKAKMSGKYIVVDKTECSVE